MLTVKVEDDDYAIKPMSCPGGMLVYKLEPRSYKEFPMRIGELGLVHRNEKSGTLHGLMRVRSFTQDDAHILMREDQVRDDMRVEADNRSHMKDKHRVNMRNDIKGNIGKK